MYFKNHILNYNEVFSENNNNIVKVENANPIIDELLQKDASLETMSEEDKFEYYIS